MASRSHFALVVLSVLTTAALASTAANARPGQGQGPRLQRSAPQIQAVDQVESAAVSVETAEVVVDLPEVTVETSDAEEQESLPFHGPVAQDPADNPQNLPFGLQRRVDNGRGLTPGLQRQVDSGRGLPPGLNR